MKRFLVFCIFFTALLACQRQSDNKKVSKIKYISKSDMDKIKQKQESKNIKLKTGSVNEQYVKLMLEPRTESKVLAILHYKEPVDIISQVKGAEIEHFDYNSEKIIKSKLWYELSVAGKKGYVHNSLIAIDSPEEVAAKQKLKSLSSMIKRVDIDTHLLNLSSGKQLELKSRVSTQEDGYAQYFTFSDYYPEVEIAIFDIYERWKPGIIGDAFHGSWQLFVSLKTGKQQIIEDNPTFSPKKQWFILVPEYDDGSPLSIWKLENDFYVKKEALSGAQLPIKWYDDSNFRVGYEKQGVNTENLIRKFTLERGKWILKK